MIQSRLTKVGGIFLALVFLFYAAAITSQSGLLLLFVGLIGGCILANWFYSRDVLKGLSVQAPGESFISEGSSPELPWRVTNHGKRVAEQVDLASPSGRIFRLHLLSSGQAAAFLPELSYARRGIYPNRNLRLFTAAPFGLVSSTRALDLPGELVVYPRLYQTPIPPVSGLEMMAGGKLTGNRRVSSGAHFAGVRVWQPGDPIKQIHWKSSARGGDLMVKTFDEELAGRLAVILVCEPCHAAHADDAARAAGSLMFTALEAGHQVDFWDADSNAFIPIPPFSDGGQMLHALARYQPAAVRDWRALAEKLPRKAAVALVAADFGADQRSFLAGLSRRGRKTSLYLPASLAAQVAGEGLFRFTGSTISAAPAERAVA